MLRAASSKSVFYSLQAFGEMESLPNTLPDGISLGPLLKIMGEFKKACDSWILLFLGWADILLIFL